MLTFEREISALQAAGALDAATAERLRALERREVFSIYPELRALSWAGVMLVVAGVGVLVGRHLDRLGPWTLAGGIALIAAACYAYAAWHRATPRALVYDYVLLLGALLLSADLAYVESQFRLLDQGWPRHLLILAVAHGVAAYVFDSRTLLALSISALAAWIGIERRVDTLLFASTETSFRAFACAALVLGWRVADAQARGSRPCPPVFDHAVANLALLGGATLALQSRTRLIGTLLTLAIAGAVIVYGVRRGAEGFILYAYAYAVLVVDVFAIDHLHRTTVALSYLVLSTVAAIVGLFALHRRHSRAGP